MTDKQTLPQRHHTKPKVIQIENRLVLSSGRWNHDAVAEYILANPSRWIETGELGKLVFGYKSSTTREKVRRRLPLLKRIMALHYNQLLVIEYSGAYGSATAVKVYDRTAAGDQQMMTLMLERMEAQRDKMLAFYQRITGMLREITVAEEIVQ